MSTALIPKIEKNKLIAIDEAAESCRTALAKTGNAISGSLVVAQAMAQLRELITADVLQSVHALQGSALGFKTDKDGKNGYTAEELKDPIIEAAVRGFNPTGNEFNIISGRFYGALAGFERKVKTYPNLTEFTDAYDPQETIGGVCKVQAIASWKINGTPDQLKRLKRTIDGQIFDDRIPVRVNSGMGLDAVIGKARRKFYAAIYDYLIGAVASTPEGDVDDLNGSPATSTPRTTRSSMFDAKFEPVGEATKTEECSPEDSSHVAEYRLKLAAIDEKPQITKIANEVRRDNRLSPNAKKEIYALLTEAGKIWPKRIDAPEDSKPEGELFE